MEQLLLSSHVTDAIPDLVILGNIQESQAKEPTSVAEPIVDDPVQGVMPAANAATYLLLVGYQ